MVNSHTQLNKGIMKKFAHSDIMIRDGAVFCYAFSNMTLPSSKQVIKALTITTASISELGTEHGYFSQSIEGVLSEKAEHPFSVFLGKLEKAIEGGKQEGELKNLVGANETVIREFLNFALARSSEVTKTVEENGTFKNIAPKSYERNNVVPLAEGKAWFNDFNIGILINTSDTEFITLSSCFYYANNAGDKTQQVILPVTPKIAFILPLKQDYIHQGFFYIEESDANQISELNKICISNEVKRENRFVIAKTIDELEKLKLFASTYALGFHDGRKAERDAQEKTRMQGKK